MRLLGRARRSSAVKRAAMAIVGLAFVAATFVFVLPAVADYDAVWATITTLSWQWLTALGLVALAAVAAVAPPWQVVLPGLGYVRALQVTQVSAALGFVVPGGPAAGIAAAVGMLRAWGFASWELTRAVTLTGLWTQFLNFTFPLVAVFLVSRTGGSTVALATVAFIGAVALGVLVGGFVTVLVSGRLARDVGDLAARGASWGKGKLRRGPVQWDGATFEGFRDEAGALVTRRWHVLTGASLAAGLTTFAVLLVSLRALDVSSGDVSGIEAFAAWSLARVAAIIPITPGGVGVVELALTGTLIGFGGPKANVVAAVLVYRIATIGPTLLAGTLAALTWRRRGGLGRSSCEDEETVPSAPKALEEDIVGMDGTTRVAERDP